MKNNTDIKIIPQKPKVIVTRKLPDDIETRMRELFETTFPAVLATISFAESSFFPIPPDPLLIALGIGNPKRAIPLAVLTTLASVAGGWLGYAIGAWAFDSVGVAILDFFQAHEIFEEVREGFIDVGFIAVLAAALTPLPYKVFTIASGAAGMPLGIFTLASVAGRGIRCRTEGSVIRS